MIDFVIDGGFYDVGMSLRAEIATAVRPFLRSRTFECLPAPRGQFRITVEDDAGEDRRFLWALVEGAALHVSLYAAGRRPFGPNPRGNTRSLHFPLLAAENAILLGSGKAQAPKSAVQENSSTI